MLIVVYNAELIGAILIRLLDFFSISVTQDECLVG